MSTFTYQESIYYLEDNEKLYTYPIFSDKDGFMLESNRPVQIAVGNGVPNAGDLVKGGVAIDVEGDKFNRIFTSSDGNNILELQVPSLAQFTALQDAVNAQAGDDLLTSATFDNDTNTLTLTSADGSVKSVVIPDDKVLLINDLTTGGTDKALTAEMGKQLKTELDTKVTAVEGKSLVANDEITKLAGMTKVDTVGETGATTGGLPTDTAIRAAIEAARPKIMEY